jgi:hypothetical protein
VARRPDVRATGYGARVSLYDWLLFLHVLAAFVLVGGLATYGALVLGRGGDVARRALATPALMLWTGGAVGVLVLGIWLTLDVDGYELWDLWIVAAIVLWLAAGRVGDLLARALRDDAEPRDAGRARMLFGVMTLITVVLLLDMIFKPGA